MPNVRVLLQPAYILHRRPFRDTSLLIEILTQDYGRVSLVAHGARAIRSGFRSRFKGLLQAFVPLLISWKGKGSLKYTESVEVQGPLPDVSEKALLYGLYLNELLLRLLHHYDPYPNLFNLYEKSLCSLRDQPKFSLCRFKKHLLLELGYALVLDYEIQSGCPIELNAIYRFNPISGFTRCQKPGAKDPYLFKGIVLLSLQQEKFSHPSDLGDAERLLWLAINHLLEGRKISSRELLVEDLVWMGSRCDVGMRSIQNDTLG